MKRKTKKIILELTRDNLMHLDKQYLKDKAFKDNKAEKWSIANSSLDETIIDQKLLVTDKKKGKFFVQIASPLQTKEEARLEITQSFKIKKTEISF